MGWLGLCFAGAPQPGLAGAVNPALGEVLTRQGKVDYGTTRGPWKDATVGQSLGIGDRVRTRELSRATLRLEDLGIKRIGELTMLEILPPHQPGSKATIDLKVGAIYLFMRGKPREFLLKMPHAVGTSRGTDFHAQVDPDGRSTVVVFDGAVELANPFGAVVVNTGEQGLVEPGQPPRKTAVIETVNVVQWWLYYPAVLDPAEIPFSAAERTALAGSLESYRTGDLMEALERYPVGRKPLSDAERVYYAGLLLAVGKVRESGQLLDALDAPSALATALRQVVAAVTLQPFTRLAPPRLPSEWLAESLYRQKEFDLAGALAAARQAARRSPEFGFAWARLAELEFSFGHRGRAKEAVQRALAVCPRHAQAWAMQGFLLSAENRMQPARRAFEHALALDGALGNAWLGRGLCRIREGDDQGGRLDLQVAAALEPNRALLRSYLGKAFANASDAARAQKELDLAKRLDPADPSAWLYSALLKQEQNRMNESVADLEESARLNGNRQVYRSRLLLDQDRAVRSANLAAIYQNAGMTNVAVGEAVRAVSHDYANHSAHLFLAESFNALRDPTRFNLRYETVWFNELLLANLLAPVGAGTLSQTVSQHEYSKLFQADGAGLITDTQWRSDGQLRERASQFGTFDNSSYALDLDYQFNEGVRPNNELSRLEWFTRFKQQVTPQDSFFFLTEYADFKSGDNFQYYDPDTQFRPDLASTDLQRPNAVVAYHREWAPGMHTLLLGGRLENDQHVSDRTNQVPVIYTTLRGGVWTLGSATLDMEYENQFETFISELNQIIQTDRQTWVIGGRFQTGEFHTENLFTEPPDLPPPICFDENDQRASCFMNPAAAASFTDDFERISGYSYYTLEVFKNFRATVGLAYDHMTYPRNYRSPPVFPGEKTKDALSPKAALVWSPSHAVTVRGAYLRSLGGVSFDETFRLEPAQVAGFVQSFRTIMPESVVGSVTAPSHETKGGAIDLKLPSRTYLEFQGQILEAEVNRDIGVLEFYNVTAPLFQWEAREELDYQETLLGFSADQLLSAEWSVGVQYAFVRSELDHSYPLIFPILRDPPHQERQSDLHHLTGRALFNHPSGFFAGVDAHWFWQENSVHYPYAERGPRNADLPGDEFPQINLFAGFRFPRQVGDVTLGLLNITGEDYHLNPLNSLPEMPRERVFFTRIRFSF